MRIHVPSESRGGSQTAATSALPALRTYSGKKEVGSKDQSEILRFAQDDRRLIFSHVLRDRNDKNRRCGNDVILERVKTGISPRGGVSRQPDIRASPFCTIR
jgi:hypothetical protein